MDDNSYNPMPEEDIQENTIETIQKNIQEQSFSIKQLILKRRDQSKAILKKVDELEMIVRDRLAHLNGQIISPENLKTKTDLQRTILDLEQTRIQEKINNIESTTRLEIQLIEIEKQKNWIHSE